MSNQFQRAPPTNFNYDSRQPARSGNPPNRESDPRINYTQSFYLPQNRSTISNSLTQQSNLQSYYTNSQPQR